MAPVNPVSSALWPLIVATPGVLSGLRALPLPSAVAMRRWRGGGVCDTAPSGLRAQLGLTRGAPFANSSLMPVTERCPRCGQTSLFVHLPAEGRPSRLLPGLGDYEYCCCNYSHVSVCVKMGLSFLQVGHVGLGHVQAGHVVTVGPCPWAVGLSRCCPFSICAFLSNLTHPVSTRAGAGHISII